MEKVSGDVTLAADITFESHGVAPHREACLLIRQSLDADSAYADAALHGDGLTSLQYREAKGALTREIQSKVAGPRRLRIEKRGKYASMSVATAAAALSPAGGSFRLELEEPITKDENNNWFPHPSPDGKSLVFLSYEPELRGHPANKDVRLRLLSLADGKIDLLAKLFGGQGTINVPSWSPDSRKLAFVSYQLIP